MLTAMIVGAGIALAGMFVGAVIHEMGVRSRD